MEEILAPLDMVNIPLVSISYRVLYMLGGIFGLGEKPRVYDFTTWMSSCWKCWDQR